MKLRKRRKNNFVIILILIFLCTWKMIDFIGDNLVPHVENIVKKNVNKSLYNYVFNIFDREILEKEDLLDIVNLNMNDEGEVVSVDYKFNVAYEYLSEGMDGLFENISNMEIDTAYKKSDDGVFFVPVGLVNNNMLLDYLGFKVPCKIKFISDIDMGFKTRVTDYGMNNLLVELYLAINIKNDLMSPSTFYEFGESYEMIIASKVVMGRIPTYYGGVIEKSSSIVSS